LSDPHESLKPFPAPTRTAQSPTDYQIRYVVWEITLRCDLACAHCGSRAGKPRENELSTQEAIEVVHQLADLGVQEITLIGGEAYLHSGWYEIAKAIAQRQMICSMATGGRNITPEKAKQIYDAEIKTVSVSIDGIGSTHDQQRGIPGAYESALTALTNLRNAGVPIAINSQINRISMEQLDALYDLVIAQGCHGWQVQITVAMGRAADQPELLLQPYELLTVIPKLADLAIKARKANVCLWPGNNIGYFGPRQSDLFISLAEEGYNMGCRAGMNVLGLESDGKIKGCPSLPSQDYTGGNLRTHRVRDVVEHSPELRFTRDRTIDSLWGYCRECYYADVCRSGCTWTGHVLFGRPGNNPYCHHRAIELEKRGLRERVILKTKAPGIPFDYGLYELLLEPMDAPIPTSIPLPSRGKRKLPVL